MLHQSIYPLTKSVSRCNRTKYTLLRVKDVQKTPPIRFASNLKSRLVPRTVASRLHNDPFCEYSVRYFSLNTNRTATGFLCLRDCNFNLGNYFRHLRAHSSVSDTHKQKVILDTSPKLVIEKAPSVDKQGDDDKLSEGQEVKVGRLTAIWAATDPYIKLMRVDKPIGTWLLFWPCSWSIALASVPGDIPPCVTLYNLGLFLTGAFIMRSAGCTINDLWDRDIDGRVERTRDRPLVSGAISERKAIALLAAQLSCGLAVLLQLNWYSVVLGASSMVLVVAYPLAKRFTDYPQLFLGATFNWGALLGWSALRGSLEPAVCLPLYAGALCWTVLYDTIYAHQDKLDDARIGIKSTALTFGAHTKPLLALAGVGAAGGLCAAGAAVGLQWPYYAAVALAGAHVTRQIYTLNTECPTDCGQKFRSNSMVGLIVLVGIMAGGWGQYSRAREQRAKKER